MPCRIYKLEFSREKFEPGPVFNNTFIAAKQPYMNGCVTIV